MYGKRGKARDYWGGKVERRKIMKQQRGKRREKARRSVRGWKKGSEMLKLIGKIVRREKRGRVILKRGKAGKRGRGGIGGTTHQ